MPIRLTGRASVRNCMKEETQSDITAASGAHTKNLPTLRKYCRNRSTPTVGNHYWGLEPGNEAKQLKLVPRPYPAALDTGTKRVWTTPNYFSGQISLARYFKTGCRKKLSGAQLPTSCSICTALQMRCRTFSGDGLCFSLVNMRQAKSQCRPSSRLISSLEKVSPGIKPLGSGGKNRDLTAGHTPHFMSLRTN